MATYGRNFEFRIPPRGAARGGRFAAPSTPLAGGAGNPTGNIPIGAPVVANLSAGLDTAGRQIVELAPQGQTTDVNPLCGVMVYEYGPAAFAGFDPYLTTYSDLDFAPFGAGVQVVAGDPAAKVVLRTTVAFDFLGIRPYPGRVMVAGMGATPSLSIGSFLVPGVGNDASGYWQTTATEAGAWLVVTSIDTVRDEVEARLLF